MDGCPIEGESLKGRGEKGMLRKMKGLFFSLFLLVVLILSYFLMRSELGSIHVENIVDALRSLGPWAAILGGGLIFLQTFFPFMPFILIAGANVLVFGLWSGFFITWVSAVIASILMFYMARTFWRDWAKKKMKNFPRIQSMNQYFRQNGFKTILFLRLFPVIPPVAVNLAAGLSAIEARAYFFGTLLGKIPVIFVQSMIGNDLFHFADNKVRLLLFAGGFGIFLLIGMREVRRKWKLS